MENTIGSKKRAPCCFCKKSFTNISRHQRRCKEGENKADKYRFIGRAVTERKLPTTNCKNCSEEFANIRRHEKLCKGPKIKIKCPKFCGKEFFQFNLERHLKTCRNASIYNCGLCPVFASSEEALDQHVGTCHVEIFEQNIQIDEPEIFKNGDIEKIKNEIRENNGDVQKIENQIQEKTLTIPGPAKKRLKFSNNYNFKTSVVNNYYQVPPKMEQNLKKLNEVCELVECNKCQSMLRNHFDVHECLPD